MEADKEKLDQAIAPPEQSNTEQLKAEPPMPEQPKQGSSMKSTVLILASAFLSMFLVAIDRTIISTAIPSITDEFNSFNDVGWYGSSYLLTCCAFQLLFGKVYTLYPTKYVFLASLLVFEVASAVCGAAPTSASFIVGRAIAGVGAAGIFAGTIVCVVYAVPLRRRPTVQGAMGALMGVATVTGPLIGGGFTSNVTWRWCFYINLPFGALAAVGIFFFAKFPTPPTAKAPLLKKLAQLDAPGTSLLVPGVVCLLLALQWGGQGYAWSNGRIIALLVLTGVFFIGFIIVQALLPQTATIPPRILKQRSVAASFWATLCIGSSQYIFVYYIPIWFQAIKGVSAGSSGIRLLPLMLGQVVASTSGGFINQKMGYYTPIGIFGVSMMSIGAGLIYTFQVTTGEGKWIGYQVLYGLGMGLCFQTPNLATQTCLPRKDVPIGIALMFFGQLLGAAVFVSVGENVLSNQLVARLSHLPGFDRSLVTSGGVTNLINSMPSDLRGTVLQAYNESLQRVFLVALILSCLATLGFFVMEWKNILKEREQNGSSKPSGEKKVEQTA